MQTQRSQRSTRGSSTRSSAGRGAGARALGKKKGGDPSIPIVQLVAAIMVTMLLAIVYSGVGHYTVFAKIAFSVFIILLAAVMAWSVRFLERREGVRRRHAPRARRMATFWMLGCMVLAHLLWILPSTPIVPRPSWAAAMAAACTVLPVFVLGFEDLRDVLAAK